MLSITRDWGFENIEERPKKICSEQGFKVQRILVSKNLIDWFGLTAHKGKFVILLQTFVAVKLHKNVEK